MKHLKDITIESLNLEICVYEEGENFYIDLKNLETSELKEGFWYRKDDFKSTQQPKKNNLNNISPLDRIGDYSREVLKEQLQLKTVVAIWDNLKKLPKKSQLDELHISCGIETEETEEQFTGFFPEDAGASVTVEQNGEFWKVIFKAPSRGLETQEGYWLSPSLLNEQIEATDFYIE